MKAEDREQLEARIRELTGWQHIPRVRIISDTSDPMSIVRGHVLHLDNHFFVIEGNKYEPRFGIEYQPKYWVFSATELESGGKKVIKTVFHEDFHVHIGVFKVHCYRSPEKEAQVLDLIRGDKRFMQGYTVIDNAGNHVRIIENIKGATIFQYAAGIDKPHEAYFHEDLPDILRSLVVSLEAIKYLHDNGLCHGDIRNDHIIIEAGSGDFRWIDFDLVQHVSDFDVWSLGNIINYVVAKGIKSFRTVMKSAEFSDAIKESIRREDASAFYEYRIMNLKKLYPYIPERLHKILMHFCITPQGRYDTVAQLLDDYREMLIHDFGGLTTG